MDMTTSPQREGAGRRKDVSDLLRRYPDVTAAEAAEILRFLKKAPPVETALLLSETELQPKLNQFREDHRSHFAFGGRDSLILLALLVAVVAACILLWDSGAGR